MYEGYPANKVSSEISRCSCFSPASLSQKNQRTMAAWGGSLKLRRDFLGGSRSRAALFAPTASDKTRGRTSGECGCAPRRAQVGARGRHTLFGRPPPRPAPPLHPILKESVTNGGDPVRSQGFLSKHFSIFFCFFSDRLTVASMCKISASAHPRTST